MREVKIYLMAPYTDTDNAKVESRVCYTAKAAGTLIRAGNVVFAPTVHCHNIARFCNLPGDISYWRDYNKHFMDWADIGIVLKLDGYKRSRGVQEECKYMFDCGKKTHFVDYLRVYELARELSNG